MSNHLVGAEAEIVGAWHAVNLALVALQHAAGDPAPVLSMAASSLERAKGHLRLHRACLPPSFAEGLSASQPESGIHTSPEPANASESLSEPHSSPTTA